MWNIDASSFLFLNTCLFSLAFSPDFQFPVKFLRSWSQSNWLLCYWCQVSKIHVKFTLTPQIYILVVRPTTIDHTIFSLPNGYNASNVFALYVTLKWTVGILTAAGLYLFVCWYVAGIVNDGRIQVESELILLVTW